jgi:nitrite reductase/ring-hydroxylating ferredoxin subunit
VSPRRFEKAVPRRDILGGFALGSFFLSVGTALLGILRLPKLGVLPESTSRFKVGFPDDFPPDSDRSIERRNVRIFRDNLGFYAISTVCSHLGCIVSEEAKGIGFNCPCHGSKFDDSGRVLSGPAPRGLPWLEISIAADGSLMVDTAKTVPPGSRFTV